VGKIAKKKQSEGVRLLITTFLAILPTGLVLKENFLDFIDW